MMNECAAQTAVQKPFQGAPRTLDPILSAKAIFRSGSRNKRVAGTIIIPAMPSRARGAACWQLHDAWPYSHSNY